MTNFLKHKADTNIRRDFWLILMIIGLLIASWNGWVRMQQAILNWDRIAALNLSPGPLYLAAIGAIWGAIALVAAAGLWIRPAWALRVARLVALFLFASYWLERALFTRAETAWTNLPFSLVFSLALLGYALYIPGRMANEGNDQVDGTAPKP